MRARLATQISEPPPPAVQVTTTSSRRRSGGPWAGFHTFRHTFASLHLSRGTNLLQLSRALGHHSAAFTLSRYTHLLPGDEAPALDLDPPTPASLSPLARAEVLGGAR
jgi:integrase